MATENNITPIIDYAKIADAQKYYAGFGFEEIPVPWIIPFEAYAATKPPERQDFYTLGGYLNASGEQGFITLLLSGKKLSRHSCVTSCFRKEETDKLHQEYFVKLELFQQGDDLEKLREMIKISQKFFDGYLPPRAKTRVIQIDQKGETFDIEDSLHCIELGSYGIRRYKEHTWIYGTGLALPRLDIVMEKNNVQKLQ